MGTTHDDSHMGEAELRSEADKIEAWLEGEE